MSGERNRSWTFLTNHARVLVKIARDPQCRLRDLAVAIGITERATQSIINDLERAGYITRTRVGRRNHYSIDVDRPFRHPADAEFQVRDLLTLFATDQPEPPEALAELPENTRPKTHQVMIHDTLRVNGV